MPPHAEKKSERRRAAPKRPERGLLFEVAWEVCNQLGGIYTVLNTKVSAMKEIWGDRYFLIGPYEPDKAALEFEELAPKGLIADAIATMRKKGVTCHFGRWLVAGRPKMILIDHQTKEAELKRKRRILWEDLGIETHTEDPMADNVIMFGFLVADFLESVCQGAGSKAVLAHFHEWMGGLAIPLIKKRRLPISSVFTTHGTLLGRYMSSAREDFYNVLDTVDPEKEAKKLGISTRYAIERLAAREANVFTTVSDLSVPEAERLLGRKPDAILPNGLDMERFEAPQEFQALHRIYKSRIHEFVMGHFFGSYVFDLDKTLYIFTAGRYEYRNKGMDVFIESLAGLNRRMIEDNSENTVVAFIVTNADVRSMNVDVLSQHTVFNDLRGVCESVEREMGRKLFNNIVMGRIPKPSNVFADDSAMRVKRSMLAWHSKKLPSVVTHDLVDQEGDPVLRKLRACGLNNAENDKVKVIYHPQFVTSTSPMLSLEYYQLVRGCNLGVFPSYYEPWGYTPMECVALGIPAVASDLSGFGTYLMKEVPDFQANGLFVLSRRKSTAGEVVEQLTDFMHDFCRLIRRQRLELRNRVERISPIFDWAGMIRNYEAAHALALKRFNADH